MRSGQGRAGGDGSDLDGGSEGLEDLILATPEELHAQNVHELVNK